MGDSGAALKLAKVLLNGQEFIHTEWGMQNETTLAEMIAEAAEEDLKAQNRDLLFVFLKLWPPKKQPEGIALILAVLILLLMSAIGIAAIEHAGAESMLSASSRRYTQTFYAADAGLQMALGQIMESPTNLEPFTADLENGKTSIQGEEIVQSGIGAPPEGYSLNIGTGYQSRVYRVRVSAEGANGSTVRLEAKIKKFEGSAGY